MRSIKEFFSKYKILIGIIITTLFLILSIKDLKYNDVIEVFINSKVTTICFLIILGIICVFTIALRWFLLLHFRKNKSYIQVFHYINIGYLFNSIFPARIGDIIRSFLWAKKTKSNKTNTLASIVIERLFDLCGLVFVFIFALFLLNLPNYITKGIAIIAIIAIVFFLFLLGLALNFSKWENRLLLFHSSRYYVWIINKIKKLSKYSQILRNWRLVIVLLFLTCIVWFIYIFSGYLVINDIHPGPFSWHASLLSLLFISLSFFLPTTPGNLGVYQYACILAFTVLDVGYSKEEAVVFSLISQVPLYILTILLGFISLFFEGYNIKGLRQYSERIKESSVNS